MTVKDLNQIGGGHVAVVDPIKEVDISQKHSNKSSAPICEQGTSAESAAPTPTDQGCTGNSEEVLIKVTLKPLSGAAIEVEVSRETWSPTHLRAHHLCPPG